MRIIAGKGKGTKLYTKKDDSTRPTADRVKEALFSIISEKVIDAKILDLFGGSGALGLESLSRGASFATFCDNDKEAIDIIKRNIEKTHNKLGKNTEVYYIDAKEFLLNTKETFDIIFLDPPYGYNINKILKIIYERKILNDSGIIVYETEVEVDEFENFVIIDKRKYGRPNIIFLRSKR